MYTMYIALSLHFCSGFFPSLGCICFIEASSGDFCSYTPAERGSPNRVCVHKNFPYRHYERLYVVTKECVNGPATAIRLNTHVIKMTTQHVIKNDAVFFEFAHQIPGCFGGEIKPRFRPVLVPVEFASMTVDLHEPTKIVRAWRSFHPPPGPNHSPSLNPYNP